LQVSGTSLIYKLWPALIVLAGGISYSNTFGASFHFDDFFNIVNNTAIRGLSDLTEILNFNPNRFIGYLSFALNYTFFGLSLWWFHFVNISIHIINAFLVFSLLQLLFRSPYLVNLPISRYKFELSLITALLFVSHPLATESVTYIIQRLNSLAVLWYLLSIICYLRARLSNNNRHALIWVSISFLSAILAFFTKENSLSLPFILASIELLFFQKSTKRNESKWWGFILTFLVFTVILTVSLIKGGDYFTEITPREGHPFSIGVFQYWISQIVVVVKYATLIVFPVNQVFDYGMAPINNVFTAHFMGSFILLILIVFFVIRYNNKWALVTFGLLWFLITISPQSVVPRPNLMFEYRAYLAILGILFAGVTLYYYFILKIKSNKHLFRYRWVLPGLIIIFFIVKTYQRNDVWHSEKTLWTDTLKKRPNNARAWVNMGVAYVNEDKLQEAIHCYTMAIKLWPDYLQAYNNRGAVYANEQKYQEALIDFQKAINLQKHFQPAWINKIRVLLILGENEKVNETLVQANKLWPDNEELLNIINTMKNN